MSPLVLPIRSAEMSVAELRRRGRRQTVESLLVRINALARERQDLRGRGASSRSLERNRLAIVRAHWALSRALIERHLSPAPARDAA